MCNELHYYSKPIAPEGFGWKVFSRPQICYNLNPTDFCPWISSGTCSYSIDKDGWIYWDNDYSKDLKLPNAGFCFLVNKDDFRHFNHHDIITDRISLKKIEYKGGLGTHPNQTTLGVGKPPIQLGICAAFRVIEE